MSHPLRIAFVGHVDHGKSTLIGRLLAEVGAVREDRWEKVRRVCEASGRDFEFAFLLDALEEEQKQGITVDVTEVSWRLEGREYLLIDTPGHRELIKNMVGGATKAEAVVFVVDAREGFAETYRTQLRVLSVLGSIPLIVVLNKMDLLGWSEAEFRRRQQEIEKEIANLGWADCKILPISAAQGVNLLRLPQEMPWFQGRSLVEEFRHLNPPKDPTTLPLRLLIQDVDLRQGVQKVIGRVESGVLEAGKELSFFPSGRRHQVLSIQTLASGCERAQAEDMFAMVVRGNFELAGAEFATEVIEPPIVSRSFEADLFWLADHELRVGTNLRLYLGAQSLSATVESLSSGPILHSGELSKVVFSFQDQVAFDLFCENEKTGRFVVADEGRPTGGGRILGEMR